VTVHVQSWMGPPLLPQLSIVHAKSVVLTAAAP
jgi:hypothetical protein